MCIILYILYLINTNITFVLSSSLGTILKKLCQIFRIKFLSTEWIQFATQSMKIFDFKLTSDSSVNLINFDFNWEK